MTAHVVKAFISGCAGTELSADERTFFADEQPWGLILFKRNCATPDQVRKLVKSFREVVGRPDAPILIDQEGGRVQRLRPPHWDDYPAGRALGVAFERAPPEGVRAAWLQGRLIAADLEDLGITIACMPVLDVAVRGASDAIGDRAFGADPAMVAELGRAVANGLLAGGVLPVIKHMPGQGRATTDSHVTLPTVDADIATLDAIDFAPFRALSDLPIAMTSHVVFSALDPDRPATTSAVVIRDMIRGRINFQGLLLSDDISMGALTGDYGERVTRITDAGCDIVLHCNGRTEEMRATAKAAHTLAGRPGERSARALALLQPPQPLDRDKARADLRALTAGARAIG